MTSIDDVWNQKARILEAQAGGPAPRTPVVRIFVPNIEEFGALIDAARERPECRVTPSSANYQVVESPEVVEFRRKELKLKPAIWNGLMSRLNGLFTGGLRGTIEVLDRDVVRIAPV